VQYIQHRHPGRPRPGNQRQHLLAKRRQGRFVPVVALQERILHINHQQCCLVHVMLLLQMMDTV
jgi:hypothetical protein